MNVIGEKAQLEELAQILGTDLPGSNKILEEARLTAKLLVVGAFPQVVAEKGL